MLATTRRSLNSLLSPVVLQVLVLWCWLQLDALWTRCCHRSTTKNQFCDVGYNSTLFELVVVTGRPPRTSSVMLATTRRSLNSLLSPVVLQEPVLWRWLQLDALWTRCCHRSTSKNQFCDVGCNSTLFELVVVTGRPPRTSSVMLAATLRSLNSLLSALPLSLSSRTSSWSFNVCCRCRQRTT